MTYKGRVHKFGDDINTDEIIPARYLNITDPGELAAHCMEHVNPRFSKSVEPGDIIVAGKNFGCGSSREHAPLAIKASGICCVVAKSFARIFYRNAINIGLPIVISEESGKIKKGNLIKVNTTKGTIKNLTRKKLFACEKYPPFIQRIIKAGGLMNYVKR